MSELDHYRTLAEPAELRHKIERSEFLGIAFPVTSEEAFFVELERVQKRWFDATHHCWAFRLFIDSRSRSADAGEPSGTAGKPILAAIEGAALHDLGVIVVRWYGGIKLGTGGLSRAYRETAAETLRVAKLLDRYVYERVGVIVVERNIHTQRASKRACGGNGRPLTAMIGPERSKTIGSPTSPRS